MTPRVLVMSGYGLNGEQEMKFGFTHCGADVDVVHINDLIDGQVSLDDYQVLAIPGGFSYGDHTGGGKAYANRITNNLGDTIHKFIKRDTLTFGICNGFQILVQLGFLPALDDNYGVRQAALIHNTSQRYQCEWIKMKVKETNCVFTKGIDTIDLPIGHGEGNFYMPDEQLDKLEAANQVVLTYCKEDGNPAGGEAPWNPNGAARDIGGVCDSTGRIFGLMPHPDRSLFFTNRPDWTKRKTQLLAEGKEVPSEGPGVKFYRNAVEYFG
jgi:phosphoribosylformylglycinamidine synthase subunit PurQ / glutaminase